MATVFLSTGLPIPEQALKDASRNILGLIPSFSEKDRDTSVKELHAVLGPLLDTADTAELSPSHRATACNFICAIVERCQVSDTLYAREAILDDFIWTRLFNIYLERSDDAKSKSVRQVLLVLTSILSKSDSPRSLELQRHATATFVDIICRRQDRIKVKPALQGLAHFLQKNVVGLAQLFDIYQDILEHLKDTTDKSSIAQSLLAAFLAWIVHHDTSLSAGHLLKNYLAHLRRPSQFARVENREEEPIWVQPVIQCLRLWPDRMQEFKTHVFPHCFLPDLDAYVYFLSFLNLERHVELKQQLPASLRSVNARANGLDDYEEFRVLLASIEKGKELAIVKDIDYRLCGTIEIRENALHLPDNIFQGWLSHTEPDVRLAGMYLSIYSTAITKPFTGGVLRTLKQNLAHLHTDADANFRRELVGYISKLFDRLRGSTATIAKSTTKGASPQNRLPIPPIQSSASKHAKKTLIDDPLAEAFGFIVWYIRFIEGELRTDASYQRRISALRALGVVLRSGLDPRVPHHHLSKRAQGQLQWMHQLQIPNLRLCRSLLDLVMDPYDDIRETSVATLNLCFESIPGEQRQVLIASLPQFIARAESAMLRTGRADHSDCVARSYALLFTTCNSDDTGTSSPHETGQNSRFTVLQSLNQQLEETLDVARRNLSEAVNGRPVHGTYAAIRYIVDTEQFYEDVQSMDIDEFARWKEIHTELLRSVETLWSCVQYILCADAPEGHVPEDMEEDMSLGTKEVLSYAWRGLKEASVLLRAVASRAPIGTGDRALLSPGTFEKLHRLCFTQLIELRHRGAFSTVAQTFGAFCRRCVSVGHDTLCKLPERLYEETLSSIQAKSHAITRRSGGIPALMTGIIAAEPQPGGKLFAQAMQDLVTEASADAQSSNIEESRLPQVHALNCIKEIFMTSRLSLPSEAYIGQGLELAARTLNSNIWPIRNCSLMLFKALIERLLGSDEAQDWKEQDRAKTSRFSYDNYPSLVGILQSLLDPAGPLKKSLDTPDSNSPMDLHGAEGVFPALQILRQATPPEEHRRAIVASVQKLLGSPHWHLRDMAARTATALLRSTELSETIESILEASTGPVNSQHGALLYAKYVLRRMLHETTTLDSHTLETVLKYLNNRASSKYLRDPCSFTKAAFLDLVSLCGIAMIEVPVHTTTTTAWNDLTATILIGPTRNITLGVTLDGALLHSSQAQVFFIDRSLLRPDHLDSMVSNTYQSIGDALLTLELLDSDTCFAALDTLHEITQIKQPKGPVMQTSLILLQVFHLARSARDVEILAKAQAVLADDLSLPQTRASVLSLIGEADILTMLEKLETECLTGPPSNAKTALHLLGFFLDWTYHAHAHLRQTLLPTLARYIRILRMTIIETNPFDARFAAVQSIAALHHIWTLRPTSKAEAPLLLGLAFVLYDMLNDDDDEIRNLAALSTSRLLSAHAPREHAPINSAVPILTSHRLAHFLTTHFQTHAALANEATCRLTATNPSTSSFAHLLRQTRKQDSALFTTEKQNLYQDPTLDALLWSRVLSGIPAHLISHSTRQNLTPWVLSALAELTRTAREEVDGALGWSAKVEVFTLGMRVLCAAGVVLAWEGASKVGGEVRGVLVGFLEAGRESEVHGLWMEKAGAVLEASVVDVVRGAYRRVSAIEKSLGR